MAYQSIFKRYEIKYLLTLEQKARLLAAMEPYMALDRYGRTTIRNIYFDTDSYRLIRRSIEKPLYKEKLRIRSYRKASPKSKVFVELKKKYRGVVYKRRLAVTEEAALAWLGGNGTTPDSQIGREIDAFLTYYGAMRPAMLLTYQREAYYCKTGGDFRITFDDRILCRTKDISLEAEEAGDPLLNEGQVLMELKTSGAIPLWLTRWLTEERVYKTSFSKYGLAYEKLIYPKGDYLYA